MLSGHWNPHASPEHLAVFLGGVATVEKLTGAPANHSVLTRAPFRRAQELVHVYAWAYAEHGVFDIPGVNEPVGFWKTMLSFPSRPIGIREAERPWEPRCGVLEFCRQLAKTPYELPDYLREAYGETWEAAKADVRRPAVSKSVKDLLAESPAIQRARAAAR